MAWRSGQSCSADLRERVLAAVDDGLPAKTAAERFGVGLSFICKALKRRRLTGETTARAQGNRQALKLAAQHAAIRAEVVLRPDVTLEEVRAWLLETHGVEASLGLMYNTLIRPERFPFACAHSDRSSPLFYRIFRVAGWFQPA